MSDPKLAAWQAIRNEAKAEFMEMLPTLTNQQLSDLIWAVGQMPADTAMMIREELAAREAFALISALAAHTVKEVK